MLLDETIWRDTPWRKRFGVFATGRGAVGLACLAACLVIAHWGIPKDETWGWAAALTLVVGGYVLFYALVIPAARRTASRHRPPHCPACTFDMRGTKSGICPECGHRTLQAEILEELAEVEEQLAAVSRDGDAE